MAAALSDVWGAAARAQADGPSYEFFKDLLPPLRYVNTEFRHYPIVLSSPAGSIKARWVSNGSGVNLRANKKPMWKEVGSPVAFRVGTPSEAFGADAARLDGPRYRDGYLPVVQVAYASGGTTYHQEAFAPVAQTCYAPILVAGGPGGEDEKGTLQLAADSIAAGAAGVMFGRRGFRAGRPAAVLDGLRSVVHDDVPVDEALARLSASSPS